MMHRRSRTPADPGDVITHDVTASGRVDFGADLGADVVADVTPVTASDATIRCEPHHDCTQHAERELYLVTTQRCRGQYP